jgi:tetratricopeptide (TPR) repeat protein
MQLLIKILKQIIYEKLHVLCICSLTLIIQVGGSAQKIDSLLSVYTTSKNQPEKDKIAKLLLQQFTMGQNINFKKIKIESFLDIAHLYKNDTVIADATFISALNASKVGDFTKSLALMYKSSKYYEKINDTFQLSFCFKEISVYYRQLKNYEEALNNITKAIDLLNLHENDNNFFYKINYLISKARVYLEMQKPDLALPIIQEANLILTKNEKTSNNFPYSHERRLRLNGAFANYYAQKKDSTLAEVYYKKCFETNTDSINEFTDTYIDACLGYSNFNKNPSKALIYARMAYQDALRKNNKMYIANTSEQLYKLFSAKHQKDSLLKYLQIYYVFTDSLKKASAENDIISSSILLRIDQLEKENKIKEENLQHRNNLQYAAIAIGLVTLLLLFFLFSNSIIVNARTIELVGTIALLMVFEFLNLLLHPLLERITHHSPILMLLALVCIAALLVPFHHRLEHYTKEKLIAKNKKIRLANAKKTIEQLEGEI